MTGPTLYLYTSLTADSSHVAAASSRLEGILAAKELPFRVVDIATDDLARALWGSRSQGRALPALVQSGAIVAGLREADEWNQSGELRARTGIGKNPIAPATDAGDVNVPDSVNRRPSLADVAEVAAQSSDNFHADNVEALGRATHHRGSCVSATSREEKDQVVRDLRQSISVESADELEDAV